MMSHFAPVTKEEVKASVFSMKSYKAQCSKCCGVDLTYGVMRMQVRGKFNDV